MKIERAAPEDHTALTTLTKRSKAFWNYSKQQLDDWDELLTITPEYILENQTFKLFSDDEIIGYYSLLEVATQTLKLDNLFISPDFIKKGYGKILLDDVIRNARKGNYASLILESDPHAEDFYSRFGFVKIGKVETSVIGRFLPIMKISLV